MADPARAPHRTACRSLPEDRRRPVIVQGAHVAQRLQGIRSLLERYAIGSWSSRRCFRLNELGVRLWMCARLGA